MLAPVNFVLRATTIGFSPKNDEIVLEEVMKIEEFTIVNQSELTRSWLLT
jgi:hypothetical protein